MQIKTTFNLAKALNDELMQVTYVAMQPGTDLHGDFVDTETIRLAKESFNESAQRSNLYHMVMTDTFKVIESYQTLADMQLNGHTVLKGSWLATLQIKSPELWGMIKREEITGISIGAIGTAQKIEEPEKE